MAWQVGTVSVPYGNWQVTDWSIPSPGVFGLIGANGSGKSQFFLQLVTWARKREGPRVGLAMQNPRLQLTEATVWDQMTWPFQKAWSKHLASGIRDQAEQLLDDWHLAEYRSAAPWELSGGMQRRLGLASLEILSPEVYLLDEPFEGLDVEHRQVLETKMRDWSHRATLIVSTHSWRWLLTHCDWGWWCEQGLTWGRVGDLWYRHGLAPESPLEELWRGLLDKGAPLAPTAWTNPDRALSEVCRIWNERPEMPSIR